MIVQKYGGTSVATTEKIAKVANNLKCRLETEEKNQIKQGAKARFSASAANCGSGGNNGAAGVMGEAIIRW